MVAPLVALEIVGTVLSAIGIGMDVYGIATDIVGEKEAEIPDEFSLVGDDFDRAIENEVRRMESSNNTTIPRSIARRPPIYTPPQLPPIDIPDRKLPTEADGQTDFDTPNGRSISLNTSLKNRAFGKLLWNPVSDEKIERKVFNYGNIGKRIQTLVEEGNRKFEAYLQGKDEIELTKWEKIQSGISEFFGGSGIDKKVTDWHKTALVFTNTSTSLTGDVKIIYGLKVLSEISWVYYNESRNALMPVIDYIPKKVKVKKQKPDNQTTYANLDNVGVASVGKIYSVLDPDQFPGELPHLLNIPYPNENPEDRQIKNYPEFLLWFIKELDSVLGEFPISIEIEDADLVQEGDQKKHIKIANLAEGISELFGLAFHGATIHDANLNILLRFIPEIVRLRQLALTTQDIVVANREFLGYREKETTKEIGSQFTLLKDFEDISKLLKAEIQKYKTIEFDGKETLMDFLLRLQFVAQLQKAALSVPTQVMQDYLNKKLNNNDDNLNDWNEFVRKINDPYSQFNIGEKPSKVRDIEGG